MGITTYMPTKRLFMNLTDGTTIYFGRGKFDDWCIYVYLPNEETPFFPLDSWYFERLQHIGVATLYPDFIKIYKLTSWRSSIFVKQLIKQLSKKYEQRTLVELVFAILYAGMIAEENKENSILGKRIKRLGVHQVLIDNFDAQIAANFSRGMPWQDIEKECLSRGF